MYRLEIRLPENRRFCGSLTLFSPSGDVVLGPLPVAGTADQELAAKNFNPTRTPLLPYGHTPQGFYRFSRLISMREGDLVDIARYGRFGIAVFDPCAGDAALAEAAGRFELWLHGGSFIEDKLSSTAGSLRVFDHDQQLLMRTLGRCGSIACSIMTDPAICGEFGEVSEATRTDYIDPPVLRVADEAILGQSAILSSLTYSNHPGLLYLGEYDSGTYFSSIDQAYITRDEGGNRSSVYVPRPGDGYTVGIGVNLSGQTQQGLLNMGVDPSVVQALSSVIGVYPPNNGTTPPGITLTDAQLSNLNTAMMNYQFNLVGQQYNNASPIANFTDLPTQAQTAIADIQYNLPGGVAQGAPTLWSQVTSGDWQAAINNLTGTNGAPPFSTRDPTLNQRAIRAGNLLQQALNAGTLPTPGH
jgi:hypothetical protein